MSKEESLSLDYKRSDVLLAMVMCSLFLKEVPMNFREKVLLCILIMKYMDMYIKTEEDIRWVDRQLKKMEDSNTTNVALCGSNASERDWTSDE
jgi:hypothetical protein